MDDRGHAARLVAQTGLPAGTHISPKEVELHLGAPLPWPLAEVVRSGQAQQVDDVAARLTGFAVGPYPELPCSAFALPIKLPGQERPAGVMVAGLSARLGLSEQYRGFIDLVAASVSAAL